MKIKTILKGIKHSDHLEEKIQKKFGKLKKYFVGGKTNTECVGSQKDSQFLFEVSIKGPTFHYHAQAQGASLRKSIDQCFKKIEKQLSKKKEKWKDHIHHKHENTQKEIQLSLIQGNPSSNEDFEEDYDDYDYDDDIKIA